MIILNLMKRSLSMIFYLLIRSAFLTMNWIHQQNLIFSMIRFAILSMFKNVQQNFLSMRLSFHKTLVHSRHTC